MASYRRRRYSRRPVRRTLRFNRRTRSFYRNMLAVRQQRDAGRFTIKVRDVITVTVPAGRLYAYDTVNIWSLLARNPQYTALSTLYDQVKINGVHVEGICRVQPPISIPYTPSYVYAWDRDGHKLGNLTDPESVYTQIASYGSSVLRAINGGTHNTFRTRIVAQDLQERSISISTSDVNISPGSSPSTTFFKPVFMIAVAQGTQDGASIDYAWETEISIDVSFRGTRYSIPVAQ